MIFRLFAFDDSREEVLHIKLKQKIFEGTRQSEYAVLLLGTCWKCRDSKSCLKSLDYTLWVFCIQLGKVFTGTTAPTLNAFKTILSSQTTENLSLPEINYSVERCSKRSMSKLCRHFLKGSGNFRICDEEAQCIVKWVSSVTKHTVNQRLHWKTFACSPPQVDVPKIDLCFNWEQSPAQLRLVFHNIRTLVGFQNLLKPWILHCFVNTWKIHRQTNNIQNM